MGATATRVTALRAAFTASVKDPAFVAESDKLGLDLFPSTGEEVTAMVQALVDTPPAIIEKAKQAMTVGSALNCEQRSAAKSCGKPQRGGD